MKFKTLIALTLFTPLLAAQQLPEQPESFSEKTAGFLEKNWDWMAAITASSIFTAATLHGYLYLKDDLMRNMDNWEINHPTKNLLLNFSSRGFIVGIHLMGMSIGWTIGRIGVQLLKKRLLSLREMVLGTANTVSEDSEAV